MRMMAGLAAASIMLAACGGEPASAPAAEAAPPVAETPVADTLTAEQKAQGWKALFNGTDLTGWKGYKKDAPGSGWVVENGELTLATAGAGA